jgi:hypothetical protein
MFHIYHASMEPLNFNKYKYTHMIMDERNIEAFVSKHMSAPRKSICNESSHLHKRECLATLEMCTS